MQRAAGADRGQGLWHLVLLNRLQLLQRDLAFLFQIRMTGLGVGFQNDNAIDIAGGDAEIGIGPALMIVSDLLEIVLAPQR